MAEQRFQQRRNAQGLGKDGQMPGGLIAGTSRVEKPFICVLEVGGEKLVLPSCSTKEVTWLT